MRAIWKGAVSFGLVSIGVKLYSATEEKDIRFHQVHRPDGGRIRYKRTCSVCGEEVNYNDIAKGYDIGGGEMVVLTDEDFADLPLTTSRAIDVLEFVPAEQVDPILYNKAYFLEPEGTAAKPYVLLRDALTDAERVAIVKVALRQREQLATLRVREGVLLLNTMLWPDEVRRPEFAFLDEEITVRPPELAMASSLIDSMTGEFEPDAFTDDYRAALQEVIDAKIEGRQVVTPEEVEKPPAAAVDLMAALRASVERARTTRGEPPAGEAVQPTPITSAKSAKKAKETAASTAKKAKEAKEAAPARKRAVAGGTGAEQPTRAAARPKKAAGPAADGRAGAAKADGARAGAAKAGATKAGAAKPDGARTGKAGKAGDKSTDTKKAARRSA